MGGSPLQRSSLIFAAAVLTASCGEPDNLRIGDVPSLEQTRQPIFGGVAADLPEHRAVVGLHPRSGNDVAAAPFCSGTLAAEDIVLTAAHCLDTATRGKSFRTMSPSAVAIYAGEQAATDPSPYLVAVVENLIHPAYDRRSNRNDIALMRLAVPVPAEEAGTVAPLPPAFGLTDIDVGTLALDFAGYGRTETGTLGLKLHVDGILGGLGCDVTGCPSSGDAATQMSYGQPEGGPCNGDSGGPAFISRDGVPYLAGVTSYGDAGCVVYGVSTRVDAFDSWISDFVSPPPPPTCEADGVCDPACDAGADPDCEPPPPPAGCGDGVCGAGESCDGRDGTAACSADCAGQTGGKPSKRYCEVEGVCVGSGCP